MIYNFCNRYSQYKMAKMENYRSELDSYIYYNVPEARLKNYSKRDLFYRFLSYNLKNYSPLSAEECYKTIREYNINCITEFDLVLNYCLLGAGLYLEKNGKGANDNIYFKKFNENLKKGLNISALSNYLATSIYNKDFALQACFLKDDLEILHDQEDMYYKLTSFAENSLILKIFKEHENICVIDDLLENSPNYYSNGTRISWGKTKSASKQKLLKALNITNIDMISAATADYSKTFMGDDKIFSGYQSIGNLTYMRHIGNCVSFLKQLIDENGIKNE